MRFESRTALTLMCLQQAEDDEKIAHIRAELEAIRLHLKARREEKYSPDQPRDWHGRWTDGGGDAQDQAGLQLAANDGTPGNNQAQNNQVNDVVRILGLTKDERRQLHKEITGQNMGFQEILRIGREIKGQ